MRLVKISKRAPIQLLAPFRVIHYNFVFIALEDILNYVVDDDEWNDTNN